MASLADTPAQVADPCARCFDDADPPADQEDGAAAGSAMLRPADRFGCQYCSTKASFTGDEKRMPRTCPTRSHAALTRDPTPYLDPATAAVMRTADVTPFTPAPERRLRTRVEELIEFAHGRGYQSLGVAFCVSMLAEAQELGRVLERAEIMPHLVCCRVGAIDYDAIGLPKAHPERFAAICNPVAQARLLAEAQVDLVVQMGLCIGHDLILQEHSNAPVTTLVVKDRALDHQPLRALRPHS